MIRRLVVFAVAVLALAACTNPNALDMCDWKYTGFKIVVKLDSTGLKQVNAAVPIDSVLVCSSDALTQG